MITKYSLGKILLILLLLLVNTYADEITDEQKVFILTDYLIKEENKLPLDARNEAIATVFGKPYFKQLSYDDDTEMFFGRVSSTKGDASKLVNFYMPRKRALAFKKNQEQATIEVEHRVKDNELEFVDIELEYNGVNYPMAIKNDTTMTLKLGGYFVAAQDTTLYTEKYGIGGSIDLQDLFNLQETTQALRVDFSYEFSQKHSLEASFFSIQNSNTNSVKEFEFQGSTISGYVNLQFDTDIYKLTYIYSAYQTNSFEFNTRVGLHLTQFATALTINGVIDGVESSNEVVSLNIPAPLPVFGLGFTYHMTKDLSIQYHVDYFFISIGVDGTMVDTQAELNYMINDSVGLSFGINSTKMDFSATVDETTYGLNHDISGLIGSVVFKY